MAQTTCISADIPLVEKKRLTPVQYVLKEKVFVYDKVLDGSDLVAPRLLIAIKKDYISEEKLAKKCQIN